MVDLTTAQPFDQLLLHSGQIVFYVGPDSVLRGVHNVAFPGEPLYRSYLSDGMNRDALLNTKAPHYSHHFSNMDIVQNITSAIRSAKASP